MPIPGGYRVYCQGECLGWVNVDEVFHITQVFQCVVDAQRRSLELI